MKEEPSVALVTGVGPGTGAAIARRFARGGYSVAMLARNRDRLEEFEGEIDHARAMSATSPKKRSSTPGSNESAEI